MPNYSLRVVNTGLTFHEVAKDREEALVMFGKQLGVRLTHKKQNIEPSYLLDEWNESPHWTNPDIPVFDLPD